MDQKKYLKLAFISTLIVGMQITLLHGVLPEIAKTFSLDYVQRGSIVFLHSLFFAIAALLSAQALSKFAYSKVILFCFLVGAIAMLLVPLASWLFAFIILVAIIAAMVGALEGSIVTFTDSLDKENSVYNVNKAQIFFSAGAVLSPLIIGIALKLSIKWQLIYMCFAFLSIAMVIAFSKVPANPNEKSKPIKLSVIKSLITDKKILLLIFAIFCYTGAEGAAWTWMSSFMRDAQNFDEFGASVALAVFWLGITIGRIISAWMTKYVEIKNQIIGWSLLAVITTILGSMVNSAIFSWVMAFVMGFSYSGIWSLIVSQATLYRADEVGMVTSVMVFSGSIGISVISWIIGVIAQNIGIKTAIASPALLFGLVVVTMFVLKKIEKKEYA